MKNKINKIKIYPGIRVWEATYKRITEIRKKSGMSIPFMIEKAVDLLEAKYKKDKTYM